MSRRKIPTPQLGGLVVLQCPSGHTLGRVASQPGGMNQPLDGPGWKGSIHAVRDVPLAMRCIDCEAEGKRLDLRGSWAKVDQLCEELEANYGRRNINYKLGG